MPFFLPFFRPETQYIVISLNRTSIYSAFAAKIGHPRWVAEMIAGNVYLNGKKVGTIVTVEKVKDDWLCLTDGTYILCGGGEFAEKIG